MSERFLAEKGGTINVLLHNPIKTYKSFISRASENFVYHGSLRKST